MQSKTNHQYRNLDGEVKEVYSPDNSNLLDSGGNNGLATTYSRSDHKHLEATQSEKGFMSAADKKKLDGLRIATSDSDEGIQPDSTGKIVIPIPTPTKKSIHGYTRANFLAGKLTFPEIQDIVRLGLAKEVFQINDKIPCNHDEYGNGVINWRVVAFNKEDLVNGGTSAPSMTLLMDKAYPGNLAFDNGIAGDSNYQYGCNTWENSDIRLWLNSKKLPGNKEETNIPGWWDTSKKTITGSSAKVPASALLNKYGFLHGIDPGFEAILAVVKKTTKDNTKTLTGASRVTQDKIFLPSYTELSFGSSYTGEGQEYDFFAGINGTSANTKRVIYNEAGSAVYWWTRTAYASSANTVGIVNADGSINGSIANPTYYSPVPACVIG